MDMNECEGVEGPSWTQDMLKTVQIDYGTINMGCRGSAVYSLINESKEDHTYKVRRRKRARVPRFVFTISNDKFSLKPKEEAQMRIEFTPLKPFETYVDYIYVYSQNFPVAKIRLQGQSIGPYIVPAVSQILFRTTGSAVAESQVELRNHSSVSGKFYFEVDNGNSIFRFYPARSIVRGGESLAITIRYHPPFEGTVEKDVFCFAEFQDPMLLHLLGVSGSSEFPECSPTIQRYPKLPSISSRRSTLEAYIHREWEAILEIKPGNPIVIRPKDISTCFQVENQTNDSFTLIWSPDAQQRFVISPRACYLHPKSIFNFNVIKNIAVYQKLSMVTGNNSNAEIGAQVDMEQDMAVSTNIDGWLFWKPPTQALPSCSQPWKDCQVLLNAEWLSSLVPINFEVTFIGQYMPKEVYPPQPECMAIPSTLIFPIKGLTQDYYTTFMIRANSCHRVLYQVIAPETGEFIVKPKQGLISQDFQVIVVHHIPRFIYVAFKENWNIAINGIVTYETQLDVMATDNTMNILFGGVGDLIHFAPTMVGCIQKRYFTVSNNSPFWVQLSCTTEARPSVLNVGQPNFTIGPHDDVIQKWEYRPLIFGSNYELVTYSAKQIRSPALRKITAKAKGNHPEESINLSSVGINSSTNHFLEDYDGQEKEYKIYAEILCRNEYPQMEPSHLQIDDLIETHHAVGSFALTNVTDAHISYHLFLLKENGTNEPIEGNIDHALYLDNAEYDISPAQGIMEPYQSKNHTCILFSTGMSPQKYSVVMKIKQTVDSDTFADHREFSLPPKKLGIISCQGAWPAVKIVDIHASVNNELLNPLILWKYLNINRINESLKSQPDTKIKTLNLEFPEQPLHSNAIYKMKIQNQSQLPVSWDVGVQHGELDMPPSMNFPKNNDVPSTSNDALKHLITLVKHQQNAAKNSKDSSHLRTVECCPKRGQKKLGSPGHGTPVVAEECPLHSVIQLLPEKGIIMPGKSETIAVEVHHELEGDFNFYFVINFITTNEEYKVHSREDIIEEEKYGDVTRDLGRVTGAIPKRRHPFYSKDLSHPLHLERTTEYHPQQDEELSKALTGIQLESEHPAMIRIGPQYESSDESDADNQAEDSLQCRIFNNCQDSVHGILGNNIFSPCHKNKVSSKKFDSSIEKKSSVISDVVRHTLWGPDFELDSSSSDESTQSLCQHQDRGDFVYVSGPSHHQLPSRKNMLSQIVPKIFTKTLKLYHSDSGSSGEDAKAMTHSKPAFAEYFRQPTDAQSNEWSNAREMKDQEIKSNLISAILLPSSEEDISKLNTHCLSQPEGKIFLSPNLMQVKKRRHSAPESEIQEWDIQKPLHMRSLSLGHIRVPRELTNSRSSSANSDSDTISDNYQSCSTMEKPMDIIKSDQMGFIRRIVLKPKSQVNEVGYNKFSRETTKWAEAPHKPLKEFESSPKGIDLKTSHDGVQKAKNARDAFYESQNKSQMKPGEMKKKCKFSKKYIKRSGLTKTEKNKKSSRKKKDSVATKLQVEEEYKTKTSNQMKNKMPQPKFLKHTNKRQGYKKQLNLKPKGMPLGYDSASYENSESPCGMESYVKDYTDSILETMRKDGASTHEKRSTFLPGQTQSYLPSSSMLDDEEPSENRNNQLVYERMMIRGTVNSDVATTSKFNLCQLNKFQEEDNSVISPKKEEELKQIIGDLIMENKGDTPHQQSIAIKHSGLPTLISIPLATSQQSTLSNPNPRSETPLLNKAKETKVWITHHPPVINSYKLQVTICTYDENQESPLNPIMKVLNSSWFVSVLENLSKGGKTGSILNKDSRDKKSENLVDQPWEKDYTDSIPNNDPVFKIMVNYKPPSNYNQINIERQLAIENNHFPYVLEDQEFDSRERNLTTPLHVLGIGQQTGISHMTGGTGVTPLRMIRNCNGPASCEEQDTPTAFVSAGLVGQVFQESIARNIVSSARNMLETSKVFASNLNEVNEADSTKKIDMQSLDERQPLFFC